MICSRPIDSLIITMYTRWFSFPLNPMPTQLLPSRLFGQKVSSTDYDAFPPTPTTSISIDPAPSFPLLLLLLGLSLYQ